MLPPIRFIAACVGKPLDGSRAYALVRFCGSAQIARQFYVGRSRSSAPHVRALATLF